MMDKKDLRSLVLYWLALVVMAAVQVYLVVIFFDYLRAGLGMGVFAVYGYLTALILTSLVWLASFWRKRNVAAAALYWLVALATIPVLLSQPIWWAAPPLN